MGAATTATARPTTTATAATPSAQMDTNSDSTSAAASSSSGTHTGPPTTASTIASGVQPLFGFMRVLTSLPSGTSCKMLWAIWEGLPSLAVASASVIPSSSISSNSSL